MSKQINIVLKLSQAKFVTSGYMLDLERKKTQLEMDYKEQAKRNANTNHAEKTTLEGTQMFSSL